jgi:hypothetical protein
MLPSRRRRCEKEANEGDTGCPQMLGNEGGCSARSHDSAAKPLHTRMADGIEKKGAMGEKGAERDGGAWGEIRNEGEEKPTRGARVRKGADEIRGTVSGVPWSCNG